MSGKFAAFLGIAMQGKMKEPKRKNCYSCKKRKENCTKFPKSVGEWLDFVCAEYKPREFSPVVLDNQ